MDKNRYFKAEALFAAANSGLGFKNFFEVLFEIKNPEKVYIIKGGPGTGKSSFMKSAAKYAEGKGYEVEYYYCSSDESSLDCAIIDNRIILTDGTAPHAADMKIPGARDEIINLGNFWDGDALAEKYSEIRELGIKKERCFERAYKYLSAALTLGQINRDLILPAVRHKKLAAAVERITKTLPKGEGFKAIPGIINNVGMKGTSRFDTYIKCAKKLYVLEDFKETAGFYLSLLIKKAQRLETEIRVSYQPVDPSVPDAVYFVETGTSFVVQDPTEIEGEFSRINMKRFVSQKQASENKIEYKNNRKLWEALLGSACDALSAAGEYHFMLEDIYMSCMDFSAKEEFTEKFCKDVFG